MHKIHYSAICMTSKFCSGLAEGLLNLFTAGHVCAILLLIVIRYHGVKRKPDRNFRAIKLTVIIFSIHSITKQKIIIWSYSVLTIFAFQHII